MGCVRGCLECCSTSCSALSRCAQQRAITISFARLGTGFGRRADEWKSVWGREYHTAPQTQQIRGGGATLHPKRNRRGCHMKLRASTRGGKGYLHTSICRRRPARELLLRSTQLSSSPS